MITIGPHLARWRAGSLVMVVSESTHMEVKQWKNGDWRRFEYLSDPVGLTSGRHYRSRNVDFQPMRICYLGGRFFECRCPVATVAAICFEAGWGWDSHQSYGHMVEKMG